MAWAESTTKRPQMKDIRCLVGYHDYVKKQIEDSQYLECRQCGTDAPTKPGDAGTA